jgi:hypothetical protein
MSFSQKSVAPTDEKGQQFASKLTLNRLREGTKPVGLSLNSILRGGGLFGSRKKKEPELIDIRKVPAPELREYVGNLVLDQVWAVLPMCVFLAGFQVLVLRLGIDGAYRIAFGLAMVVVGLALFNFGLLYGLMPSGKELGIKLPLALPLEHLLAVAGILGVAVTLAEPALGVVKHAGSLIDEAQAPYLYSLLHHKQVQSLFSPPPSIHSGFTYVSFLALSIP